MNWKTSSNSWEIKNEDILRRLMTNSAEWFKSKYDFQIYKETTSFSQLLQQAEIDVLGVNFEEGSQYLNAVDVAFHEAGLNYGGKNETVMTYELDFTP
jgi:hypothetical protein